MNGIRGIGLLLGVAMMTAGCGQKNEDNPKAVAGTELLPRSVTDDMLPYDTVRSQASLAAPETSVGATSSASKQARTPQASSSEPETAAPAPASGALEDNGTFTTAP